MVDHGQNHLFNNFFGGNLRRRLTFASLKFCNVMQGNNGLKLKNFALVVYLTLFSFHLCIKMLHVSAICFRVEFTVSIALCSIQMN